MSAVDDIDSAILGHLRPCGDATYVVRNRLHSFGKGPNLTTAQVLRRLKRLESAGLCERATTAYRVMIAWRTPNTKKESTND